MLIIIDMYQENKVVIYTTNYCPYCVKAKALFKVREINYIEIDITNQPQTRMQLANATGRQTVPQIYIHTTYIGGCDDLYKLKDENKLDELLALISPK